MNIFLFRRYKIKSEKPDRTLTALFKSGIDFSSPKKEEEGVSFSASFFKKKRIRELFGEVEYQNKGIVSRLFFLKERKGLLFGSLFALFLIYLSTFFVWSVKIEGNEDISSEEIERLLFECGFYEGVRKSEIEVNEVQNEMLLRCHELSFASINIHGMTADVVVHERKRSSTPDPTPCNLVADADGIILSFVILDGQKMFEVGNTVVKGELLVSGIIDSAREGYRLTNADGKVFAKTFRTLDFFHPVTSLEREAVSEECFTRASILGKKFGKKAGGLGSDFDIEVENAPLILFGIELPARKESVKVTYFEARERVFGDEELKEILTEEYRKYLSTELDSGEILEEEFTFEVKDGMAHLSVSLVATENIAVKEKIKI